MSLDVPPRERLRPRGGRAVALALLLVVVLGQRLALPLPGPQVQLTLVAVLVAVGVLVARGDVEADRVRLQLYLLGALACTAAAVVTSGTANPLSLPSWAVLLVLWVPWVYRLRGATSRDYLWFARWYVRLMLVLAAVAVLQLATQLVGVWRYEDYLGELPEVALIQGYNTSIPLEFGASVYKSTAFVFLEPSFLSQYCALAVVVALLVRAPLWQLVLLGLGLASAVSGTGIVLLAVGVLLMLLRRPSALRPSVVGPAALVAAGFLATPFAQLLLARRDELTRPGSSGNSRFVAPYLEVVAGLTGDPWRYLVGAGPGTATRMLESSARGQLGDAVVYNIPAKLLFEYGVPAAAAFIVFIVVAVMHRAPAPVIPGSILLMLFVLSGSLLQPHTVVLAWLLTGLWTGSRHRVGEAAHQRPGRQDERRAVTA